MKQQQREARAAEALSAERRAQKAADKAAERERKEQESGSFFPAGTHLPRAGVSAHMARTPARAARGRRGRRRHPCRETVCLGKPCALHDRR